MRAISGTNVFGKKVPPRDAINTTTSRRLWPHFESTFPLGRFGMDYTPKLKAKNLGIVKLSTDDVQIDFGLLLRADEDNQIRVAVKSGGRRSPYWQVLAVCRDRILELRRLD